MAIQKFVVTNIYAHRKNTITQCSTTIQGEGYVCTLTIRTDYTHTFHPFTLSGRSIKGEPKPIPMPI